MEEDKGIYHIGNKLNELSSKEWLKFTKSWFVHNPVRRKEHVMLHPAKYPESMIKEFVSFFTKPGQVVFDPFLGTGSTLIACHDTGRVGIGFELQQKYADIANSRIKEIQEQQTLLGTAVKTEQRVINADIQRLKKVWLEENLPDIDFVITSPPYGNMLRKKGLAQEKRGSLDTHYSDSEKDLGNIENTAEFVKALINVFVTTKQFMVSGAYLVVIIQNYMHGKEYVPLAWDVGKELSKYFLFRGERLWCQDNKTLFPYGYRYSFVPNVHHHYCLIFKKE